MKKTFQFIFILLVTFIGLTASAQTIKIEQVYVPIYKPGSPDIFGSGGSPPTFDPQASQKILNNYASNGYTLVSSQIVNLNNPSNHTGQQLLLIFQKIDPPSEKEIKKLLDQSLLDMEKRIREQLVSEINALPTKLDTDQDFLDALYKQIKSEISAKFILIEKSNDIKTLDDYKKSLYKALEAEFDLRYKKK